MNFSLSSISLFCFFLLFSSVQGFVTRIFHPKPNLFQHKNVRHLKFLQLEQQTQMVIIQFEHTYAKNILSDLSRKGLADEHYQNRFHRLEQIIKIYKDWINRDKVIRNTPTTNITRLKFNKLSKEEQDEYQRTQKENEEFLIQAINEEIIRTNKKLEYDEKDFLAGKPLPPF